MVLKKACIICVTSVAFCCMSGCGVYSFSGKMGSGIETVAVPVFDNQTVEFGIAEDISAGVIDRFVADNTLKVVARSRADAVLEGTVTQYDRAAYTYDENDQVQEYKVNISVDIRLIKADGSVVWEENGLSSYGIYDAAASEEEGQSKAIGKIAEDIVNRTVRDW
jgi:hypothetical protein